MSDGHMRDRAVKAVRVMTNGAGNQTGKYAR